MDRLSLAIAAAALVLFFGLVVAVSLMTDSAEPPRVSCTGSTTCKTVPRPTFNDDPIPPSTRPRQEP